MSNRRLTSSIAGIARLIDPGIGCGLVLALNLIKPKPSCSRRYKLAKLPSNQQLEVTSGSARCYDLCGWLNLLKATSHPMPLLTFTNGFLFIGLGVQRGDDDPYKL